MSEQYRCIRFELFDKHPNTSFDELVRAIKLSFDAHAGCHIHSEEYKRSENNLFVTIEVRGDESAIEIATQETQAAFSQLCATATNNCWFA